MAEGESEVKEVPANSASLSDVVMDDNENEEVEEELYEEEDDADERMRLSRIHHELSVKKALRTLLKYNQ